MHERPPKMPSQGVRDETAQNPPAPQQEEAAQLSPRLHADGDEKHAGEEHKHCGERCQAEKKDGPQHGVSREQGIRESECCEDSCVHHLGQSDIPSEFAADAYRDSFYRYCDLYGLWGLKAFGKISAAVRRFLGGRG